MFRQGLVVAFVGVLTTIILFTYFSNDPVTTSIPKQKQVIIVGGGAAGIVAALRLVEKDPLIEISLFDKGDNFTKTIFPLF